MDNAALNGPTSRAGRAEGAGRPSARVQAPCAGPSVVAVVVTRNRAELLRRCLASLTGQVLPPAQILVVDNASSDHTAEVVAACPGARHHRLSGNQGGAGGFHAGITAALAAGADLVWLMDDDGEAADPQCLARLLGTALEEDADIVGPLVVDDRDPDRLAFPYRLRGRTRFLLREVAHLPRIGGFAHLFNGVLVRARTFREIGLPERRFFIRGDEVEFLYRAQRHGLSVVTDTRARFRHPGSAAEIHPVFGGAFYAVMPPTEMKRFHQFRNRAYIFSRYGRWVYLAADVARYGYFFLVSRRLDLSGWGRWTAATWRGLRGDFTPWTP